MINIINRQKNTILFFGIDKTGSTSIVELFRNNFDHLRLRRDLNNQKFHKEVKYIHKKFGGNFTQDSYIKTSTKSNYLFIDGFSVAPEWHAGKIKFSKNDFSFTFLRHPIDRLFSYAYFYKKKRAPFLSHNTEEDIKNLLSKKSKMQDLFWLQQDRSFDKSSLDNLSFVGITEKMNQSLQIISNKLNTSFLEIKNLNQTKKEDKERSLLKLKYFDDLCGLYAQDIEIYQYFADKLNELS